MTPARTSASIERAIEAQAAPKRRVRDRTQGPERKLEPRKLDGDFKDAQATSVTVLNARRYAGLSNEELKQVKNGKDVVEAENGAYRHAEYTRGFQFFPDKHDPAVHDKAFDFVFLFNAGFDIELLLLCRGSETELKPCADNPKPLCGLFVRARLKTLTEDPNDTVYVEWLDRWTGETWKPSGDRNPAYDEVNLRDELFGWRVREPFQFHKLNEVSDRYLETRCALSFLVEYKGDDTKDVLQSAYAPYTKFKLMPESKTPRNNGKSDFGCTKKQFKERMRAAMVNSILERECYNGMPTPRDFALVLECTRCKAVQDRSTARCGTCNTLRSFELRAVKSYRLNEEASERHIADWTGRISSVVDWTGRDVSGSAPTIKYNLLYKPHDVVKLDKPFKGARFVVVVQVSNDSLGVFGVCSEDKTCSSFLIKDGELPVHWSSNVMHRGGEPCSKLRVCGCKGSDDSIKKKGRANDCAVGRWSHCPDVLCCGCHVNTTVIDSAMTEEKCNAFIQQQPHSPHDKCTGYTSPVSMIPSSSSSKLSLKRKSPAVIEIDADEPTPKRAAVDVDVFVPETPRNVVEIKAKPSASPKLEFDVIGDATNNFKRLKVSIPMRSNLKEAERVSCLMHLGHTDTAGQYSLMTGDTHVMMFDSDWKRATANGTKSPGTLMLYRINKAKTVPVRVNTPVIDLRSSADTPPLAQDSQAPPTMLVLTYSFVDRTTAISGQRKQYLRFGTSLQEAERVARMDCGVDGPLHRAYKLYDVSTGTFLDAHRWFKLTKGATTAIPNSHEIQLREFKPSSKDEGMESLDADEPMIQRSDSEIVLEQLA